MSFDMETETSATNNDQSNKDEEAIAIRQALQYKLANFMTEQELANTNSSTSWSTDSLKTLTELLFQYSTQILANDVHDFAKHRSKRNPKVTEDDVLLVVRRNPELLQHLELQRKKKSPTKPKRKACAKKNTSVPLATKTASLQERLDKKICYSASSSSEDEAMPPAVSKAPGKPIGFALKDTVSSSSEDEALPTAIFKVPTKSLSLSLKDTDSSSSSSEDEFDAPRKNITASKRRQVHSLYDDSDDSID